ncbi:MAG: hypothetical protein IJU16_00205, partial [Clostridia bacterium]|nr:hypothetical protein [Clostridia bacterium]
MKKAISVLLALVLTMALLPFSAFAEDTTVVYVTISAANDLSLTQAPVTVTDIDGDNALTINDALYLAHEQYYEGGAAAGYGSYVHEQYGLSLSKLWGVENGGSYGYYINHTSPWNLASTVANGDYIDAFVYTDTKYWTDTYCWFDKHEATADVN